MQGQLNLLVRSHANDILRTVEDDELGFEEDIAVDREASRRSLDTTKASVSANRREVDEATGNNSLVVSSNINT